jgi:hypothetical protein
MCIWSQLCMAQLKHPTRTAANKLQQAGPIKRHCPPWSNVAFSGQRRKLALQSRGSSQHAPPMTPSATVRALPPIMACLQAIKNCVAQSADCGRGGHGGRRLKNGSAGSCSNMRERALGASCAPHKSSCPGMVESSDPTL